MNRILKVFLTLVLMTILSTSAMAASSGFNASLTVDRTNEENGTFTVTVVADEANNTILSSQQPTLTVPCSYEYAKVIFDGFEIESTLNSIDKAISFTVSTGGTYTITEAELPTITEFIVTIDANGGVFDEEVPVPYTITTENGLLSQNIVLPSRTGYNLVGWADAPSAGNAVDLASIFSKDTTVYAQWTVKTYTVSFINEGNEWQKKDVDHGVALNQPEQKPTKSGYYVFNGWYTDAGCTEKYDFSTPISSNVTLYAGWHYNRPYVPSVPSIPTVVTQTTKNADGSVTTIKTNNRIGTVIETTKNTDGSTTVVETLKDGTITTTETDIDGNSIEIVEHTNGTVQTTITSTTGTAVTTVDGDGTTTVEVVLSEQAFTNSIETGEAIILPMVAVTSSVDTETAATVTITTNTESTTKVEIPVTGVTTSTVAIILAEDGTETIIQTTQLTKNGISVNVPDGTTVKIVDKAATFADVDDNDWAQDAVNFASARGLIIGVGNNRYDLDGITTRAQVMTLLARLSGVDTAPTEGEFWYTKGQQWAMDNGISDGTFPDREITREEMMTMLWRFVGSPSSSHDISHFTDSDKLSPWTEDAAHWAVEIGLVQGNGNGTITPKVVTSRGQLAQFLMNFIQLI